MFHVLQRAAQTNPKLKAVDWAQPVPADPQDWEINPEALLRVRTNVAAIAAHTDPGTDARRDHRTTEDAEEAAGDEDLEADELERRPGLDRNPGRRGGPVTPAPQVWGIATAPTRDTRVATGLRGLRTAGSVLVVTVTVLLGAAGTVMASTSSANADILGISGSVQDWICGIVNPSEPWEGVGDGPESWMSNRNLAGAKQIAPIQVDATGQAFSAAPPGHRCHPRHHGPTTGPPTGGLHPLRGRRASAACPGGRSR